MWFSGTTFPAKGKFPVSGQRLAGLITVTDSQSSIRVPTYSTCQAADQLPEFQPTSMLARCFGMPPVTALVPGSPPAVMVVPDNSWDDNVALGPNGMVATYSLTKVQVMLALKSPTEVEGNL